MMSRKHDRQLFSVFSSFCVSAPGKQPPCWHERIFAGQRTANGISRKLAANGFAASWPPTALPQAARSIAVTGQQKGVPLSHEENFYLPLDGK